MTEFRTVVIGLIVEGLGELGVATAGDNEELLRGLSHPPNPEMGDLAFACFPLARQLRKSPVMIAKDLAEAVGARLGLEHRFARKSNQNTLSPNPSPASGRGGPDKSRDGAALVESVEANGPYVNFRASIPALATALLPGVISSDSLRSDVGGGKTVVIDFSSPNVAKPFGIGHLRSTAIGAAIGRLYRALGYRVVGINHLGDWGTQFGKLITAWKLWGDEGELENSPILHLYELYVRFHKEEKSNEELAQSGRDWFKRLEDGDEEARLLWKRFRDVSLTEFDRIYQRMGVSFDHIWGESYYEGKMSPAIERIREAGVLVESEGAMIVPVEEFYPNTSPCLILRSDGASLYATRDVTAAFYRYEQFEFDRLLYVTGADQGDHFNKVFGVLKRLGLPWADRCEHVPFGRIQGISTRQGTLVFLEDVFDRARKLSLEKMRDREMSDEEREREAEKIGVGAVVFFDLSKERIKDAQFNWDEILRITGRTGMGLQYTGVRLKSLLMKYSDQYGQLPDPTGLDYSLIKEAELKALIHHLGEFGAVITRAADSYEPAILSRYLLDGADLFNGFYSSGEKIISDDAALSAVRITMCRALLGVLTEGLTILGVPMPDRM